jgi:hypothetical protein
MLSSLDFPRPEHAVLCRSLHTAAVMQLHGAEQTAQGGVTRRGTSYLQPAEVLEKQTILYKQTIYETIIDMRKICRDNTFNELIWM